MFDLKPKTFNSKRTYFEHIPIIVGALCLRIQRKHMHIHDCAELWYSLSGEGIHYIGNEIYRQTPGTCVIVPSFVPHELYTSDSEDTPVFICVNPSDKAIREFGYNYYSYHKPEIEFEGKKLPVFKKFNEAQVGIAHNIMRKISLEFSKNINMDKKLLCEYYIEFLRLLDGKKSTYSITEPRIKRAESILNAVDFIRDHFSEKITMERLCDITQMNKSAFSEHFKRITGFSASEFTQCCRLGNAELCLMFKKMTLSKIAEENGFYDKAQFSRLFKAHFGYSPIIYKNRMAEYMLKNDLETRKRRSDLDDLRDFFAKQKL